MQETRSPEGFLSGHKHFLRMTAEGQRDYTPAAVVRRLEERRRRPTGRQYIAVVSGSDTPDLRPIFRIDRPSSA